MLKKSPILLVFLLLLFSINPAHALIIEDFEDGNLSEYTFLGSGPTISTAAAHDGTYGLEVSNSAWIYRNDAQVQLAQGDTFSTWVNFFDTADARAYFGFGASSVGALSFVLAPNTGDIRFQENPSYGFTELNTSPQTFVPDKWYRAEVLWGISGSLAGNLYDSDGTTLLNTVTSNSTLYSSGGIAFRGFTSVKGFDTVDVLKVEPIPEPTTMLLLGAGVIGIAGLGRRRFFRKG